MAEPVVGQEFAGYRVLDLLGKGGMGAVYSVSNPHLDRTEALKSLALDSGGDFARRFAQEAKTVASLDHPNIVTIHHYGIDDGTPWFTMQHLTGSDLTGAAPLPAHEVLEVVSRVADALDYAHGRGVVHRDIKPGNVLIQRTDAGRINRVTVLDFGIARLADATTVTATNTLVGTLAYSAPETIIGEQATAAADQYSLACTAYQLLSAQPVFTGSIPTLLQAKVNQDAPPISTRAPQFAALDPVFARALHRDPTTRFATCYEFVEALATALGPDHSATLLASSYQAPAIHTPTPHTPAPHNLNTPAPSPTGPNPAFQTPAPAFQTPGQDHFPLMVDQPPQHGGFGHPQSMQYLPEPEPGTIRPITKARLMTVAAAGLLTAVLGLVDNLWGYFPIERIEWHYTQHASLDFSYGDGHEYIPAALGVIALLGSILAITRPDWRLAGVAAAWAGIGAGVMTTAYYLQAMQYGLSMFSMVTYLLFAAVAVLLGSSISTLVSVKGPPRVAGRGWWRLLITLLIVALFFSATIAATWTFTLSTCLLPITTALGLVLAGTAVAPAGVPAFNPDGWLGRAAHLTLAASALSTVLLLWWTYLAHGPDLRVHGDFITRNALNWGTPVVAVLLLVTVAACARSLRPRSTTPAPLPAAPMY